MHVVDRFLAACQEGPAAVERLLAPGFTFEAAGRTLSRTDFLRLVADMRAHGACLTAENVQHHGDAYRGRITTGPGPIEARWVPDGDRIGSFVLDALPGALEHLVQPQLAASGDRPGRPGARADADAPLGKVDPGNVGPHVERMKRLQDREGIRQRAAPAQAVVQADPLDIQNEVPRGPAHEGGWSRDQGLEQSGSSLDEEPNTRADGSTTQGGYDGGRRREPDTHRKGGRSRSG